MVIAARSRCRNRIKSTAFSRHRRALPRPSQGSTGGAPVAAVTKASRPGHLHLFRAVHSSEERSLFDRRVYCNFRRARDCNSPPMRHWYWHIGTLRSRECRRDRFGPIKITAPLEFGREELAPIADQFQLLHPSTQIMLHLADDVIELVEKNIDVALHFGPLSNSTLRARLLLRAKRVVCAAPSYRETRGIPERPEDLSQHNCLVQARPDATFATWTFQVDGKLTSVRVRGDRIANESKSLRNWATAGRGILRRAAFGIRGSNRAPAIWSPHSTHFRSVQIYTP